MTHRTSRSLLIASAAWLLLIAAGAYLTYPTIGPIAIISEPNVFWLLDATGTQASPFKVTLKTSAWLAWCLLPVAALWLVAWAFTRRQSRGAA